MNTGGEIAHVTGQLPAKTDRRFGTLGAVLHGRNFRLLWIGQGISVLGDQFYMIALPWLVLQLTGDALAVGTVLALVAFPRALFMLVGGALIDRFSPRNVMLASDALRLVLVTVLTLLILAGVFRCGCSMALPFSSGWQRVFYPAQPALIPQLLEEDELADRKCPQHGNSATRHLRRTSGSWGLDRPAGYWKLARSGWNFAHARYRYRLRRRCLELPRFARDLVDDTSQNYNRSC